MWSHRYSKENRGYKPSQSQKFFIDKEFQVKYTMLTIGTTTIGIAIVFSIIHYFTNQNYQIFLELAYNQAPGLIKHLEREQNWINSLILGTSSGLVIFFFILGIKMTARIVGPLKVLKNHLKLLSRGRWDINTISVRKDDEFQDIIESYNYFFSAFRTNLKKDLKLIKSLKVDPNDRDSYLAWRSLVEEKSLQLNSIDESVIEMPIALSASDSDESRDSRHAS